MLCLLLSLTIPKRIEQQCSSEPYYIDTGDISEATYPDAYKHTKVVIEGKIITLKEKAFYSSTECLRFLTIKATDSVLIQSLALGSTKLDSIFISSENDITVKGDMISGSVVKNITIKTKKNLKIESALSKASINNFVIEASSYNSPLLSSVTIDYFILTSNVIQITKDTFSSATFKKGVTLTSESNLVLENFNVAKFSGDFCIFTNTVSIYKNAFQGISFGTFEIHSYKQGQKLKKINIAEKSFQKSSFDTLEIHSDGSINIGPEAFYQSSISNMIINSSYCLVNDEAFEFAIASALTFMGKVHLFQDAFAHALISSLSFVEAILTFEDDPFRDAIINSITYQGGLIQISSEYKDEIVLQAEYGVYIKKEAYTSKKLKNIEITATKIVIDEKAFESSQIGTMKLTSSSDIEINYESFKETTISGSITLISEKKLIVGSGAFEESKFKTLNIIQKNNDPLNSVHLKEEAFQRTTELVSVIINGSSVQIDEKAFDSSSMLNLNISASSLLIGELTFRGCSLVLVGLRGGNITVGKGALRQCGVAALFVNATGRLKVDEESCAHTQIGIFHVSAGSINLGMKALMNVSGEHVILHSKGSIELGTMALSDTHVTRAYIEAGELSMGGFAFQRSEIAKMEIICIKTLVIQQSAFLELPYLRFLAIEGMNGVIIQPGSVRECKALTSIQIDAGGTLSINPDALYRLDSLEEVNLSACGNIDVLRGAFRGCTIKTVRIEGMTIKFNEASLYEKSKIDSLIVGAHGDITFAKAAFSEGVEVGRIEIIASGNIGRNAASIHFGERAFEGSSNLTTALAKADGEINIERSAFNGASSLGRLVLRSGVKVSIGREAFLNCELLDGVVVEPLQNAAIDESAFEGCPKVDLGKKKTEPNVALIAGSVAGAVAAAGLAVFLAVFFARRAARRKSDVPSGTREA